MDSGVCYTDSTLYASYVLVLYALYYKIYIAIREDPHRGFYVEGLQEYAVRSYNEAEALVNLGLENRAIAPTLMNATSSRYVITDGYYNILDCMLILC